MSELFGAGIWLGLAAFLLAVAVVGNSLSLVRAKGRWIVVAAGTAAAAAIALTVALVVHGLSPSQTLAPRASLALDPQQVLLGLVLAMLLAQLILAWRLQVEAASLVVDLAALILVLIAAFLPQAGESGLYCQQAALPTYFQWVWILVGAGGLAVAGSAGLTLALRAGLAQRGPSVHWPRRIDLHALVKRATALALFSLGFGLAVHLLGAWRLVGASTFLEPPAGWTLVALLVAAMSYLARRIQGRWGRWTAGLAMVAALVAFLGLLNGIDLWHYFAA